ncbi:alpha/beta hydrolase [Streptomyces clavuligerus]|nr:alpha/beta hydrolase [Streptomyces clavuligerus]ANW18975.1 hydrolase [Streptomyces clavuligerus]AXU13555.1 alpha/beta hydrolase [Streptomyces clavuligerus]MBY6303514.1 alpha/beta fold hydrolase [Streptomyces clavuligerus]QCS06339.1 alpha/beta hydrolase [Streptomyces clavuligerus]QPJ94305.1 alpha/beta fold hydrolase [Streptomyces clavuligerus]
MASLAGPGIASAAPAPAAAAPKASPLAPYEKQKPNWKRCATAFPAAFQCATIKVPLDYKRPGGKTLDLAISRYKTSVAGKRQGVLLFNPGGPGGPGVDMPLFMHDALPRAIRDGYDLIGFDPRGVGGSSPVTCGLTQSDMTWPRPYQEKTFAKDVAWAKGVADKCRKKQGEKLPHITTRNTARDMDVLRIVLGEKKLNYLGYSYGTQLGAVYTQLFPTKTGRFVLDSAVDPKLAWRGMIQIWAEGAEPAFKRWAQWTAERNSRYKLGATEAAVTKTFWDLVAQADRKPIVFEGEPYDGAGLRNLLRGEFFGVEGAARTVVDLKKAAAGKPVKRVAPRSQAPAPRFFAPPPEDNMDAAFWAVVCADNSAAWPRDTEQYRKDAIRDKARYPLYGDFGSNIKPCAFWGDSVEPGIVINNSVPSLVVQNEWDSQTPYTAGLGMRKALKGSKLLTVKNGEGHGVYLAGVSPCADRTITGYLTTGKLPAKDTVCTNPVPRISGPGHDRTAPNPLPLPAGRF